jgi:uncharacterized protein (DUF427 family)
MIYNTETMDRIYLEWSQFTKAETHKQKVLLHAVKEAYKKHHLGIDDIGWDELSETLLNALCEAMGDDGYLSWLEGVKP